MTRRDYEIFPTQLWRAQFWCDGHKGWQELTWVWTQPAPESCLCGYPILIHRNKGEPVSYEAHRVSA